MGPQNRNLPITGKIWKFLLNLGINRENANLNRLNWISSINSIQTGATFEAKTRMSKSTNPSTNIKASFHPKKMIKLFGLGVGATRKGNFTHQQSDNLLVFCGVVWKSNGGLNPPKLLNANAALEHAGQWIMRLPLCIFHSLKTSYVYWFLTVGIHWHTPDLNTFTIR